MGKMLNPFPRSPEWENINLVLEHLLEDQKISARRNGLNLSKDTFQRIVKYDLEWYPYKMRARHELLQAD